MIIVADASVLIAQLLRQDGIKLIKRSEISVVVADAQWNETWYELNRRLEVMVSYGKITTSGATTRQQEIQDLIEDETIEIVVSGIYEQFEVIARRRVPRDPNDWPSVALAIALNAGILTNDHDFLGCGCPTWTVETLLSELEDEPLRS